MRWPWSAKPEAEMRQSVGYTSEIIAARAQYFSGSRGVAEATATVEMCASLWERAFSTADTPENWRTVVTPSILALIGRGLAQRGQAVFLIENDGQAVTLTPAVDWDVATRRGRPIAYRLSIPEAGGGFNVNALVDEVVDIRINVDPATPWHGQSPLRRARLTGDTLAAIEAGLGEVMGGTWGSQVLPIPELNDQQRTAVEDRLRGRRGGLALVETVKSLAAGAPPPQGDWTSRQLTPDIRGLDLQANWETVRSTIVAAYGIPPILFSDKAQTAAMREGQRHAVLWSLAPIAKIASAELAIKLGDSDFRLDLVTPLAAADSAARARALGILVSNGIALDKALTLVGWGDQIDS